MTRVIARIKDRLSAFLTGLGRLRKRAAASTPPGPPPQPAPDPAAKKELHPDRQVERLRIKLFELGFETRAYADLASMARNGRTAKHRAAAARQLAIWHANKNTAADAGRAMEWLQVMFVDETKPERLLAARILAAECEQRMNLHDQAWERIRQAIAREPQNLDLLLAAGNLAGPGAGEGESVARQRVDWINKALTLAGHAPVTLSPGNAPAYDRLHAPQTRANRETGPLVTVIVPVYNAETTLPTALNALLAQTWASMEIIVVDDASTDGTCALISTYAEKDNRIRLLRSPANAGPYVARNIALDQARGGFVTCHDADDWSHPEKIEIQVRHLMATPEVVANTSRQARAFSDLRLHRRGNPGFYLFPNFSSLLFRTAPVRDRLGYWDSVRFGADSEMVRRISLAFGPSAVAHLPTGPLSLQRQSDGSLTSDPVFGFHGYPTGARRDYLEASQWFYQRAGEKQLSYSFPQLRRPFAVAAPMITTKASQPADGGPLSCVIAADFRVLDDAGRAALDLLKQQPGGGGDVGLVQVSRYEVNPHQMVDGSIREQTDGRRVRFIVHGESVVCETLHVFDPLVFRHRQNHLPDIRARRTCGWLCSPPPEGLTAHDMDECERNLELLAASNPGWNGMETTVTEAWRRWAWQHGHGMRFRTS